MRVLLLLGMACIAGCGTYATLEELEHQAALTGDWSAVEKRERIIARREAKRGPTCPSGYVAYCQTNLGSMRCACVGRDRLVDVMSSLR